MPPLQVETEVKHYRKEDCPSEVGSRSQQHTHQSINGSSSERRDCLKKSEERHSSKSSAIWKCPPKFHLNEKWLVVAGEESQEASKQEYRKMRVIEAVFPNNSYNLSDLEQGYDDSQTRVVRTISIEEEEPTHDLKVLVAIAVAAVQEQGSLIDANLLVRLLLNLMNERGMATNVVSLNASHAGSAKSVPLTMTKPDIRESKSITYSTSELDVENIKKLINKYGVPNNAGGEISELVSRYGPTTLQPKLTFSPNVGLSSSMTSHKDINNYCNSLIKQCGAKTESIVDESLQKPIPCNLTPCIFFNKPKGCRKGFSYHFLHDIFGK
ncbi:zinc finger CCCH domain-containing protein 6-like [Solanum pennellii]|uniref:Zinc finger CCCH domain-containing protein 6-like n=1 Tax=Solanum pennellii TaxID=28526 RepID=A0ABM1G1P8_SOLPN|nr:zinc finger CCCH domain-containing protein 6-like [Solanum pennellii]